VGADPLSVALVDLPEEGLCPHCDRALLRELPRDISRYCLIATYLYRARRWVDGLTEAATAMSWFDHGRWSHCSPFRHDFLLAR
jgi:hypothetical protein